MDLRFFTFVLMVLFTTSCATLMSETCYPVSIRCNPENSSVMIKNKSGKVVAEGETPLKVTLPVSSGFFSKENYTVILSKEGYKQYITTIPCSIDPFYFGNIWVGGIIGMLIIDPGTGAMYKIDKSEIEVTLIPERVDNTISVHQQ